MIEGVRIEGTVEIDGENIYHKDVDVEMLRKRVGMVFQAPNPFPKSIYDNVAYGPRIHGIQTRRGWTNRGEKPEGGRPVG